MTHLKRKLMMTLALLLTAVGGAWADETPLLTINSRDYKSFKSGSKTFDDKVTVTFSNSVYNDGNADGWYTYDGSLLTVAGTNGYTITSCKFYVEGNGTAKNGYTIEGESPSIYLYMGNVYTDANHSVNIGELGITKIEIYGAAASSASAVEVAWDKAKKTGSFTMPGGNVTLEPEYYPQAALATGGAPTAINDVPATTDGAIVKAGTVKNIGETTTAQGTVMYYVSQKALDDAALLALAADKWTADVPTAKSLTKGQAYVYYYVRGNDSNTDAENFSDGDILSANALTVTIAAEPTYAVTFAEGNDPNEWTASPAAGVKKGEQVTVTYTGSKKVLGVKAEKKASAEEPVTQATPLTMEAQTDGTIEVKISDGSGNSSTLSTGMKYAVNGGEKTTITTTTTINVTKGDKVKFYGNGTSTTAYGNNPFVILKGTAKTKVYGNIMSLLDETGYETATTLSSEKVFNGLFQANTNLTDASGLLLPAMTLTSGCYNAMFGGCTSLTAAPALPATTLAQTCYYSMFGGCTSLTAAPELPATTLANACYNQMFRSCTSLTTAPVLPATTLANACYYMMFHTCSSLNSVTCLATDISASSCTNNWLYNVSATGTITTPSATNWTANSSSGIPSGWTRVNVDN